MIEFQFAELENFDVFDLFDSSEVVESKGSNLLLYYFYKHFYENLTDASESAKKRIIISF